jgi:tRNA pseudouridine32 synthase/23S rRNA pseudouridine746 synthase
VNASAIETLFESEALLAVNKPEGISSIPERDLGVPSVRRVLEGARGETLFVVHRLDKEVSGVLLFAKNAVAHRELSIAFEQRRVEKRYLAVVHGRIEKDELVIDAPLREYGSGRMGVDPRGKPSRTRVRVIERAPSTTLVEVRPETGRRHQIRAHLYSEGHALVGDSRYGDTKKNQGGRLMLHASRLVLPALSFSAPPSLEAPLGETFRRELSRLGVSAPEGSKGAEAPREAHDG